LIALPRALAAWCSPGFAATLAAELQGLPPGSLPLQQGLRSGSVALEDGIGFSLIAAGSDAAHIDLRVGVFYSGIVAGCNCADDPSPVEPVPEYCELALSIDRATAQARVRLVES
jgi:hypothetical protein